MRMIGLVMAAALLSGPALAEDIEIDFTGKTPKISVNKSGGVLGKILPGNDPDCSTITLSCPGHPEVKECCPIDYSATCGPPPTIFCR